MGRVNLLDCTLRDGGLGLEDAFINKLADIGFSENDYLSTLNNLQKSNIDIIELGSIEITPDDRRRFAIFRDVESLSTVMPKRKNDGQLFVGMYRGPDTPVDKIPNWQHGLVEGIRVIIRYSELQKSLDFCASLSQKGYKTFIQPMLTMRYTEDEIALIIDEANKMNAYALYFVDSYGYMEEDDIQHFFSRYDSELRPEIKIGFHAHNNENLAYANTRSFINTVCNSNREIIIDSCIIGMGQGAGNLQTELIAPYLLNKALGNYDYSSILDACDIVEKYLQVGLWGYSVTRLLPAIHKTAYKYAIALRHHYGMNYSKIDSILQNMPNELRHRYTKENVTKILEAYDGCFN